MVPFRKSQISAGFRSGVLTLKSKVNNRLVEYLFPEAIKGWSGM